jgi:hypothetical protein
MVYIAVVESVYSAVRTDSLYKADYVWSLESLNKTITDWFLQPWWKVFTARYGLVPYIKQITFGL